MSQPLQYLTNEVGERVGVVLDWSTYLQLSNSSEANQQYLVGLSVEELNALASCKLALADQARLDTLIAGNTESLLCDDEVKELDNLLAKADQLTILKARARYTLKSMDKALAGGA